MKRATMTARSVLVALLALVGGLVALAALVIWLNVRGEGDDRAMATSDIAGPAAIERGAYLARIGNCAGCHTDRGGRPYAGGRGISTPFGTVYASNLTPDAQTGIGAWSSADFWRALHHGRSRDGRLLYPAFPYPNYTQVTRDDADALFAFLRSQPAVEQPNPAHALRWPYSTQAALAVWRALYFKPVAFEPDTRQTADWNRGAYLVNGLGHCVACHAPRNLLGATQSEAELSGGLIPMQHWYAPSLTDAREAGVADWALADIEQLLQTGRAARGSALVTVMGPMAEVVFRSTQYLSADDARAMATYLKLLPQAQAQAQAQVQTARSPDSAPASAPTGSAAAGSLARGAKLYEDRCSTCHGDAGEGAAPAYPPLAGNRAVIMASPANVIRVVISGGYLPATAGNPRPYGMPPFGQALSDEEIAAVTSFIRQSWGNKADAVSALAVRQSR